MLLSMPKLFLSYFQVETPRLYLSQYQQSPYIAKIRPVALYFLDFEATITLEQFNNIPKSVTQILSDIHHYLQYFHIT